MAKPLSLTPCWLAGSTPTDSGNLVIDTNILVSALLRPFGHPARIFDLVIAGQVMPCYDGRIIAEYAEVLARPAFRFDAQVNGATIHHIRTHGWAVAAPPLRRHLPDESDRPFLEVSEAAQALIVTGNLKHFPDARAVSASDFLDLFFGR